MSSPFPFHIGYVLDYVCHSGTLPNDGSFFLVFFNAEFSSFMNQIPTNESLSVSVIVNAKVAVNTDVWLLLQEACLAPC